MGIVTETYGAHPLGVNFDNVVTSGGSQLGGFLCSTSGTITVYDNVAKSGAVIANALPVVAGGYYPMPFGLAIGCYVTLGGGASGTIGVN